MEKKKITVEIAGSPITLVTDEPEDFVRLLTDTISERIAELTKNSFRISTLDASLLLAVDYLGDKLKAERKIRSLEAQLSLYEVNMKKLEDELKQMNTAEENGDSEQSKSDAATIGNTIKDASNGQESKIKVLENYLDSKKSDNGSAKSREEKIKYIESLLRGNSENE